ncbi:hypothetical protein [Dictyobacter kobayashii]|uniref:Uncharacterized protein n=1 Tax=Dictyobacter kobayashii TaxID=2014872 RepID=A0A402AF79_9CHLR|nr:hypothetical protein [Dictyobacter kobayashii]GCE17722.1 hypothetical protein KDK_15220 [Dictyobacter kobayashii]
MQAKTDPKPIAAEDEYLFGWNPTPGIVSVWAHRDGRALVWRRVGGSIVRSAENYRPWLLATSLQDVSYLGNALQPYNEHVGHKITLRYRELGGPETSYRYLLFARDGRLLERAILEGAGHRLRRPFNSINELGDAYYRVGAVEQYLMSTGQVYFRGMLYQDLHRLQFDLETTALDPIVAVSSWWLCGIIVALSAYWRPAHRKRRRN